ncbi:MAG: SH3 domain-containing protein [Deltaproteobacteria bacterium]|nr:SH3 domain-containing protein [Deltaproteobacteria bacterium]
MDRRYLVVKRHDGHTATFRIGWRTRYYPDRRPRLGERVRVGYVYRKGENVGYTVTMLNSARRYRDPAPVTVPETALSGQVTVMKKRVNIRTGPGRGYPVVTRVSTGQVLKLKGRIGSWYQVHVKGRKVTGWIYSNLVRVDRLERIQGGSKKI